MNQITKKSFPLPTRITQAVVKAGAKIQSLLTYGIAWLSMMTMNLNFALAGDAGGGGDAKGLLEEIIKIVASLITALAVVLSVLGIVHYASAHSEGDGPAKQKAIMQIAAGIMLILLSVILRNEAGNLGTFMSEGIN